MKSKIIYTGVASLLSLALIGCGGSGPKNEQETKQTVSGFVLDPAIKGSLVTLCQDDNLDECLQFNAATTDTDGSFDISDISSDVNMSSYYAVARGGVDVATGVRFDNIEMTSPADLRINDKVIISPISSMLHANDWNVSQLASYLGLSEDDIKGNPMANAKLQRISLLLATIASERTDGFADIDIKDGNFTAYLNNSDLDAETKRALNLVADYLRGTGFVADDVVSRYVALHTVLSSLAYDISDKDDTVLSNIRKWADAIMRAATGAGVSQPNLAQIEALFSITEDLNLSDPNLNITDLNVSLISYFSTLMPAGTVINHKEDLASAIGADDAFGSAKRVYYYNSTASHLYQAEMLIKGINDVSITDEMYVKIAQGYIANGETDRGLGYARNKIFQKDGKADVLREVAEKLIGTDNAQATALLDEAFVLYKEVTEAKGAGNMKNKDIFDYRFLLQDFVALGEDAKADQVKDYILTKSNEFTNTSQWGSFQVGLYNTAVAQLENGNTTEAIATLYDAYDFAQNIPPNYKDTKPTSKQYYKVKVFAYARIAVKLAEAGDHAKAIEVADAAQAIRADDGIPDNTGKYDTGKKTESYVHMFIIPAYALAGDAAKALASIDTVSNLRKQSCYIVYAKALAMTETTLTEAFNVVDNNITDYDDKMKALTYNGVNKGGDFIAQYMVEHGENIKAKQAIDKALIILNLAVTGNKESSAKDKSKNYVRYGYSKLANLYAMIGEDALALVNFEIAIAIADGTYDGSNANIIVDEAKYQVEALEEIINHLDEVSLTAKAATVITKARDIVAMMATNKEKLSSYNKILSSDGKYTEKEAIADAMKILIDNSGGDIGESSDDKNKQKIVDYLIKMANAMYIIDNNAKADDLLKSAVTYAEAIANTPDKVKKLQAIVEAYAKIGMIEKASAVVEKIAFAGDKRKAIGDIAVGVYKYDAFPQSDIATVDTDKDGKPDFFNVGTTQDQIDESGLILDDDSDGDGTLDEADLTPFYDNL